MECPKCRFNNPEKSKYCLECGGKLELVCTLTASHYSIGEYDRMIEIAPEIVELIENHKKNHNPNTWLWG